MPTKVLTKGEADKLGLIPKREAAKAPGRRTNPHVQEIMDQVKSTKPGQFVVYDPSDKKSFQSQVLRIRQAFDLLGKAWPHTRPMENGQYTVMHILSKRDSFERYPQQPLAKAAAEKSNQAPKPEVKRPGRRKKGK